MIFDGTCIKSKLLRVLVSGFNIFIEYFDLKCWLMWCLHGTLNYHMPQEPWNCWNHVHCHTQDLWMQHRYAKYNLKRFLHVLGSSFLVWKERWNRVRKISHGILNLPTAWGKNITLTRIFGSNWSMSVKKISNFIQN